MGFGGKKSFATIGERFRNYLRNTSGNITLIFALSSIPLFVAVGAAVDSVRIGSEHANFNAAMDTVCLAVAGDDRVAVSGNTATNTANLAALTQLANNYIKTNYSPARGYEATPQVTLSISGQAVIGEGVLQYPTSIMKLFGTNNVTLKARCKAALAMRPVELVLVMDTTGSMASSNKLTDAKAAAHSLLNIIYGGSRASVLRSEYIRVAMVPFAAAVKIDPATAGVNNWIDRTGTNPLSVLNFTGGTYNNYTAWAQLRTSSGATIPWNGCVEARARGDAAAGTDYNVNDAAPNTANPATLFPAYFAPDTPSIANSTTYNTVGSPGLWKAYSYYNSYITETSTATSPVTVTTGETRGMTVAQRQDMTVAGQLARLRNPNKYTLATISGSESSGSVGPWTGCVATPIVPMTYNRESVEAGIDAMTARGPTEIPEGLAWGLRVISPGEPFSTASGSGTIPAAAISPFNGPRWQKVMLLMTDGDNDLSPGIDEVSTSSYTSAQVNNMNPIIKQINDIAYSAYGFPQAAAPNNRLGSAPVALTSVITSLDTEMLNVCSKIKSAGVTLYVTSFGSGVSQTTKDRLSACATDAAHYQHSSATTDLTAFFNHVGQDVLNKMVYVAE